MFKALDEKQRLEFLSEIWTSLSTEAQQEFLKIAHGNESASELDEARTMTESISEMPQSSPKPKTGERTKEASLKAAMSQFERIQQEHMTEQKKSFRKEFFSCLGLGVLGLLALLIISVGLRWVWDIFTS